MDKQKNDKSKQSQPAEGRRKFLASATTFAAAGFILTPLITSCGGGEEDAPAPGKKKKPGTTGGGATPQGGTPTPPPTPAGKLELVDTPEAVGARGTLKIVTKTTQAEKLVHYKEEADENIKAAVNSVNKGAGPYKDQVSLVRAGDGVANVIFVLTPEKGKKALRNTTDAHGANWHFRFTSAMTGGVSNAQTKRKIVYLIGDTIQHEVSLKKGQEDLPKVTGVREAGKGPKPAEFEAPRSAGLWKTTCGMHTWEEGFLYLSEHAYVAATGSRFDAKDQHEGTHSFVQATDAEGKELLDGTCVMQNVPVGKHSVKVFHNGKELKDKAFEVEIKEGDNSANVTI